LETTTTDLVARPRPLKVQSAYETLKRMIVTLELRPGSQLDERDLMDKLGIGRTPLREAMLRLSHERLIVHTPRRGARVSDLSLLDLQQMIEARTHIEPLVTMLAAERMTDGFLLRLQTLMLDVEAAAAANAVERLVNRDLEFHTLIARASGNRYFAMMAEQVNTAMLRFWFVSYAGIAGLPLSVDHHRVLFEALATRDPEAARERSLDHIEIFKERMSNLVVCTLRRYRNERKSSHSFQPLSRLTVLTARVRRRRLMTREIYPPYFQRIRRGDIRSGWKTPRKEAATLELDWPKAASGLPGSVAGCP
jgi:GntR family transcriptional regulator, rspAB operon transcriptional repressor